MTTEPLRFSELHERHAGVTEEIAKNYAQATRVCLDRHHTSPTEFLLSDNHRQARAQVEWTVTDDRARNAWANDDEATRDGAYGIGLAAVELMRGLVAVRRAETRTGADYYLGKPGMPLNDLEASYRLEISGTDGGNDSAISARLRQKLEQARKGRSNLPAIASVVGFAARKVMSADLVAEET